MSKIDIGLLFDLVSSGNLVGLEAYIQEWVVPGADCVHTIETLATVALDYIDDPEVMEILDRYVNRCESYL